MGLYLSLLSLAYKNRLDPLADGFLLSLSLSLSHQLFDFFHANHRSLEMSTITQDELFHIDLALNIFATNWNEPIHPRNFTKCACGSPPLTPSACTPPPSTPVPVLIDHSDNDASEINQGGLVYQTELYDGSSDDLSVYSNGYSATYISISEAYYDQQYEPETPTSPQGLAGKEKRSPSAASLSFVVSLFHRRNVRYPSKHTLPISGITTQRKPPFHTALSLKHGSVKQGVSFGKLGKLQKIWTGRKSRHESTEPPVSCAVAHAYEHSLQIGMMVL